MLKGRIRITYCLLKKEERTIPPKKKMRQKEMSSIFLPDIPEKVSSLGKWHLTPGDIA
jgi:hypothetical protein